MNTYRISWFDQGWKDYQFEAENDEQARQRLAERNKITRFNLFLSKWNPHGYSKITNLPGGWEPVKQKEEA